MKRDIHRIVAGQWVQASGSSRTSRRIRASSEGHTCLGYVTDEAQEGRDAFLEKRDPDWSDFPWHY